MSDGSQEATERVAAVTEARAWVGTPYCHAARVKGAAVDCAQILAGVFAGAGLIPDVTIAPYPPDWHLHRGEERYLAHLEIYFGRVDDDDRPLCKRGADFRAKSGDILMWRWGRTFSHSAIVTDWPNVIHAFASERFVVECDVQGTPMTTHPMRVYSYWSGK